MRRGVIQWSVAAAAIAALAGLAVNRGWAERWDVRAAQEPVRDRSMVGQQEQAFREGGYEAAARVTGAYTRLSPVPAVGGPADLKELLAWTDHALVGTVEGHRMRLAADGRGIWTIYDVIVEEVLKGHTERRIQVFVPGGRVMTGGGSYATERVPRFTPPLNGRRYVMFVVPSTVNVVAPAGDPVLAERFELADVYLGVFDVSDPNRLVRASGVMRSPVEREIGSGAFVPGGFISFVREQAR